MLCSHESKLRATFGQQGVEPQRSLFCTLELYQERILAYAYFEAGEQAVRMWVGAETETDE